MVGDFSTEFKQYKKEFGKILALSGVPQNRLREELRFVFDASHKWRRLAGYGDDFLSLANVARECIKRLRNLQSDFEDLPKDIRRQVIDAYDISKDENEQFALAEDVIGDACHKLITAGKVFALMGGGLYWPLGGQMRPKRRIPTAQIWPAVANAMRAWHYMTGSDVSFAKGLEWKGGRLRQKNGEIPERPLQDDAYFVFLCVKMVTGKHDPSGVITTVNRLRQEERQLRDFRKRKSEILPAVRKEVRRLIGEQGLSSDEAKHLEQMMIRRARGMIERKTDQLDFLEKFSQHTDWVRRRFYRL